VEHARFFHRAIQFNLNALTALVAQQEGHLACKNLNVFMLLAVI